MGMLTVVLLAALWASILLPGALRARRESSPLESVSNFERSMVVLAPNRIRPNAPPGRHVLVLEHPRSVTGPSNRARILARRRRALLRLVGAVPVSGLLALLLGGPFTWAPLLAVLALVGYVAVLANVRAREAELRRKVRRLPVALPEADHERDLAQRAASGVRRGA